MEECINWFHAAALTEAKLLVRGELWQAKFREWDLMRQLLRMLEWRHQAVHGWDYDTCYNGKRIAQWADAELREAAESCWSPYDATAMRASLLRAVDLFARLAETVTDRLGRPQFDHRRVRVEVRRLLALGDTPATGTETPGRRPPDSAGMLWDGLVPVREPRDLAAAGRGTAGP